MVEVPRADPLSVRLWKGQWNCLAAVTTVNMEVGVQRQDQALLVEYKRKHGVNFEEAQALWSDPELLEIPARATDELRWVVIGKMDEKHWPAVITRRSENVRIKCGFPSLDG